jgi:hypothetical protein
MIRRPLRPTSFDRAYGFPLDGGLTTECSGFTRLKGIIGQALIPGKKYEKAG